MQQTFEISGMHCGGCVNRVTKALKSVASEASVTLEPPRATLTVNAPLSVAEVQKVVSQAGEYKVTALA